MNEGTCFCRQVGVMDKDCVWYQCLCFNFVSVSTKVDTKG